jgi:hypothetical protein
MHKALGLISRTEKEKEEEKENHCNMAGMVAYICNPSTWEEYKFKASQSYMVRFCLKKL